MTATPEPTTELYFEAHVTIDPVLAPAPLEVLKSSAALYGFKVADLVLCRNGLDEPSARDSFCTGRGQSYSDLLARTKGLVSHLTSSGFVVRRYKLENTLLDVRT